MMPLTINNGLCVVCNNKKYRPYSSTCADCYKTADYKTIKTLSEKASKKANEELLRSK
tara:strand:+ start:1122 stop:1295 length:174 start_codon:yes stop_codon:yes gene_type:complete